MAEVPANGEDLAYLPAVEQRRLLLDRTVSARELLDACLAQVAAWNGPVNAIVTLDPEGAMARASELDEALAHGTVAGPLHGLVVAHKDLLATAGMRTTQGNLLHKDDVPLEDAEIAARMRRAGCV